MTTHPQDADESRRRDAAENLRFAVEDLQKSIRGADHKTEVLGVVLTVLLAIAQWEGQISLPSWNGFLGIAAILSALAAFLFGGLAIWPRLNPWQEFPLGDYVPSKVLYPPNAEDEGVSVSAHAHKALTSDWVGELSYELCKLGVIQRAKQHWFRWALRASALVVLAVGFRLFFPATPA